MAVDPNQVRDAFLSAVELSPERRAAYLDRVCGGDGELREEVSRLLAADARPDSMIESLIAGMPGATGSFASEGPADARATLTFGGDTAGGATDTELNEVVAGRYRLTGVIGQGGMGTVYRASQTEPVRREVALKLIRVGMDSKAVVARFDAERQALALMDHPNIARVFDGGTTDRGQPFFVMELIDGVPITTYCDRERLTVPARLELFALVCQAVQHAHQKGIIHRDLKPGNVLVTTTDGRPAPKVIDFGVAKATEFNLTEQSLADAGMIVGTPAYMSPEQADPLSSDIDTRTDVYALGVILYELLTGSPPLDARDFKRGAVMEMLRMVRESDPPKPSTKLSASKQLPDIAASRHLEPDQLKRALRGDLDWIVMKALEKDRVRRYDSAISFADDIRRHLAHEPVVAAPPGRGYRLRKFVRKNRGAVVAAGLVFGALLAGIAGTTLGLLRADNRRQEADRARADEADRVRERDAALGAAKNALARESERVRERDEAVRAANAKGSELAYQLGVSNMVLAGTAFADRQAPLAAQRLMSVPPEQRGWEWHYLLRQTRGGIFVCEAHPGGASDVAFSPDGKRLASCGRDKTVKIWDTRTGRLLLELKGHTAPVLSLAYSPDGRQLVTSGDEGKVIAWDALAGTRLFELAPNVNPNQVVRAVHSPDGSRIVTYAGHTVREWDAKSGAPLSGPAGTQPPNSFFRARSRDGSRELFSAGGWLQVREARTGSRVSVLQVQPISVTAVALSPDGERAITGTLQDWASVWDTRTGKALFLLTDFTGQIACADYSPDGTRIVTGSNDMTLRIWDARAGTVLADLKGHRAVVRQAVHSPDGALIASAGADGAVIVWDARAGSAAAEFKSPGASPGDVDLSPDGARLVVAHGNKPAVVWDVRARRPLTELKKMTETARLASFSPDGETILVGGFGDRGSSVWDVRSGDKLFHLTPPVPDPRGQTFSPDGSKIFTCGDGETGRVYDARTGKQLCSLKGPPRSYPGAEESAAAGCFSPDGSKVLTTRGDGLMVWWDARTGKLLAELPVKLTSPVGVSLDQEGTRIISRHHHGRAVIWDAATGKIQLELTGHVGAVTGAALHPDGSRAFTLGQDGKLKVWDVRTGAALLTLKAHPQAWKLSVSRDGSRVVTCGTDGVVRLWTSRPEDNNNPANAWNADEIVDRLTQTRPDLTHHLTALSNARSDDDRLAIRFHVERLLAMPDWRTVWQFQARLSDSADPLVAARTSFHHPHFADTPYDRGIVQRMALEGDRLAIRLVAQQCLRDGKPGAAVPLLYASMASRPANSPPVEELLLAVAFQALGREDDAKRLYRAATDWLDRPLKPMRAANLITHAAVNGWAGLGEVFKPVDDPRHNPMDWESWHECDVFRRNIEIVLNGGAERR